mmetsp:Transcript_2173/g.4737  ORF Transcript_2173/g.4737 Transcript_2173/m.4737 type:complete len:535 (+) Transcript_2173:251-1855(+)
MIHLRTSTSTSTSTSTKLSRQKFTVAAIAAVGMMAYSANELMSSDLGIKSLTIGLSDHTAAYYNQGSLRRMSTPDPKINLNAPYAPYKGEIEPVNRQLSTYEVGIDNATGEEIISCTTGPIYGPDEIPTNVDFQTTIVVGYPGADKRIVLRQMEMMTTMSGRDAWDFKYLGMTNQPYIKTNYPHHEGVWGWQDHADQVVLIVRNIRHTIDEYHDILADINYAKTWVEATEMIPRLYLGEVFADSYIRWRDERTMDEIGWYGWLIDYWMEGGVLRDYFDHKLTTKEHWAKLRAPETFTYGELQWDVNICETDDVLPGVEYDDLCANTTTADCKAKIVISAERLMDPATGHEENRKIGRLLNKTAGVNETLIDEAAWDCLYDTLIGENPNGTSPEGTEGFHDYRAREGTADRKHFVSTRHLNKMVQQLTRLINKYSQFDPETNTDWAASEQAQFLVVILTEHRLEVQAELDEKLALPEQLDAEGNVIDQNWAHPPKPNWVVFPMCGAESRRVWDYNYPHEYSGLVLDMFPELNTEA